MSVQEGYKEDAERRAQQCRNYDIVLTGINDVDGSDTLIVGYKYKEQRKRCIVPKGADIAKVIRSEINE